MTRPIRSVSRVAPVDTLVVTVGGSPVPVLLAMLALRPRRVIAVHTRQSAPVWWRVEALYRRLVGDSDRLGDEPELAAEAHEVNPHDAAETVAAIGVLRDRPGWSLAYAGGTPTMSAAAFESWWQAHGVGDASSRVDAADRGRGATASAASHDTSGAWYVAEDGDALLRHDGLLLESRDVLAGIEFSPVDVIRLHGLEPLGDPVRWSPHVPTRTAEELVAEIGTLGSCYPSDRRQAVEKHIHALVADALAHILARRGGYLVELGEVEDPDNFERINARTPADLVIVSGMAVSLLRPAVFPDATKGDGCHSRGTPRGTRGLGLSWPVGQLKEQLFDAQRVAQAIGGIRARCAILTLASPSSVRQSAEVVAVVDTGPDFRPGRLGLSSVRGDEEVEPLPAMVGFNRADLMFALVQCAQGVPLPECDELTRWIAWETEV